VPAILRCGALSNSPVKWPAFTSALELKVSGDQITAGGRGALRISVIFWSAIIVLLLAGMPGSSGGGIGSDIGRPEQ
jgi:hypothetical protein